MPAAQKSWKGPVIEWLYDNRLFNSPPSAGVLWKPIIRQLMTSDKERFLDLIGERCPTMLTRRNSNASPARSHHHHNLCKHFRQSRSRSSQQGVQHQTSQPRYLVWRSEQVPDTATCHSRKARRCSSSLYRRGCALRGVSLLEGAFVPHLTGAHDELLADCPNRAGALNTDSEDHQPILTTFWAASHF